MMADRLCSRAHRGRARRGIFGAAPPGMEVQLWARNRVFMYRVLWVSFLRLRNARVP